MPVSDRELRAGIEGMLGRPVARLSGRRACPYRSSYPIEELTVQLDGGRPQRVLLKELSFAALSPEAAAAKPGFLLDGAREIEAYDRLLGGPVLDAPACYAAASEPGTARAWILLEAVDGDPLWQIGAMEAWEAAARWLASLHGCIPAGRGQRLLGYDAKFFRAWIQRALEFTQSEALERIATSYERVVSRLAGWPVSFVHGEFYPSNVMVEHHGGRFRIRPVDWEMAGVGPGLLDLAALSAGAWSADSRERLARAYFEVAPRELRGSSWSDFLDALDHCRLHLAVQWLGWAPDWSPPADHANDWLAEAVEMAERLRL